MKPFKGEVVDAKVVNVNKVRRATCAGLHVIEGVQLPLERWPAISTDS